MQFSKRILRHEVEKKKIERPKKKKLRIPFKLSCKPLWGCCTSRCMISNLDRFKGNGKTHMGV